MATKNVIAELLIEIGMDSAKAERSADRISANLDKVSKSAKRAESKVGGAEKRLRQFAKAGALAGSAANKIGLALGAAAAAVGGIGAAVLKTGGSFERLEVQLKTATGSAEGARKAFDFIRDFTKNTPFQLEQVTGAFVKLQNFGLEPTEQTLTAFGDLASAMGKNLDQITEAVLDATTGDFERLKEFGIRARQQGDQVALTFRGITTTVGNNSAEIQKFLVGISEENFAGAMANEMETLGGTLSNARDMMAEFFNTVAQSGPLAEFKALINDLKAAAGGQGGLADALGRLLTNAIRKVRRLLSGDLVGTLKRVLSVLEFVIVNFEKLVALFVGLKLVSGIAALTAAFSGLGLSVAALTGPIGIAIAALTTLGITAVAVHRKISAIPKIPTVEKLEKDFAARASAGTLKEIGDLEKKVASARARGNIAEAEGLSNQLRAANEKARREASKSAAATGASQQARKFKRIEDQAAVEALLGIDAVTNPDAEAVNLISETLQGGGTTEDAVEAVRASRAAPGAPGAPEAEKKRKGGGRRRKAKEEAPPITSPTTISEFFGAAARGELGPIADRTPSPSEIEPTVAVSIANFNFSGSDTFNITGTADPMETAKNVAAEVTTQIQAKLASAGQRLATNIER